MIKERMTTNRQQQQQQQQQQQKERVQRRRWYSSIYNLSIYHVVGILFIINIVSQKRKWKQLLLEDTLTTTTTNRRNNNNNNSTNHPAASKSTTNPSNQLLSSVGKFTDNAFDEFVRSITTTVQDEVGGGTSKDEGDEQLLEESILLGGDDGKSTIESLSNNITSTVTGNWFDKFVQSTLVQEATNTNNTDNISSDHYPNNTNQQHQHQETRGIGNDETNTTSTTNTTTKKDNGFAACLLIMDDNHNIIEWIAYHYYVLPLQYLVIAIDPRSTTDPTEILQRYNTTLQDLTIEIWYNESMYIPNVTRDLYRAAEYQKLDAQRKATKTNARTNDIDRNNFLTIEVIQHRIRQGYFYSKCLQYHYTNNRTWTTFIDSDEYLLLNYPTINEKLKKVDTAQQNITNNDEKVKQQQQQQDLFNSIRHVPSIQEYGSVLQFINNPFYQQLFFPYLAPKNDLLNTTASNNKFTTNTLIPNDTPCVQVPRRRFGSIPYISTSSSDTNNKLLQKNHSPTISFQPQLSSTNTIHGTLSTRTYFYHALDGDMTQNGLSKAIINVQYLQSDDVVNTNGGGNNNNAHRPSMKYCSRKNLWIAAPDQVLLIHHYLGSWEQFNYRNDSRRSYDRFMKTANSQEGFNAALYPWLDGFINLIGNETAQYLLQDVGEIAT